MSVLITGGTGSFGQAFTRKLLFDPGLPRAERICIYSRDEVKQAHMRESLGNPQNTRWFIGDVRDKDRLERAMIGVNVVVHAAALKRIEVGQYAPDEMVKTNVLGALNVVEAAASRGVKKVVVLSTDKAHKPISPYGQSKALAESIFLNANNIFGEHGPKFSVCRYGNIAGSNGSVIPKWREILKTSDTVPVTDPDCTRFWMLLSEAADLVQHTIATMKGGELNIPILPSYRLGDLAEAMGAKMNITGLPKWEKLHECMGDENCSNDAKRMSVEEIREGLRHV